MKHLSLYLLIAAMTQNVGYGDVTKLSAENRRALQDASRFHEVHSVKDLPSVVVALCVGDKGRLAEPGQNWNATDSITDPTLPDKRLIWAEVNDDYYLVHHERGGIAHSFHILVAKMSREDTKPRVIWKALGGPFKKLYRVSRCIADREVGRSIRLCTLNCSESS